jgi:hypothetical protein
MTLNTSPSYGEPRSSLHTTEHDLSTGYDAFDPPFAVGRLALSFLFLGFRCLMNPFNRSESPHILVHGGSIHSDGAASLTSLLVTESMPAESLTVQQD